MTGVVAAMKVVVVGISQNFLKGLVVTVWLLLLGAYGEFLVLFSITSLSFVALSV